MAVLYPSQQWCDEWKKAINTSQAIMSTGKNWGVGFNGNLVFEIRPGAGLDKTTYLFISSAAGKCTDCRIIEDPSTVDYGFHVTGDYSNFKEVVKGDKDFIAGVVTGIFKLSGPMFRIMTNAKFIRAVANSISSFEAEYLGEK
jgi:putative sterol carrier protein